MLAIIKAYRAGLFRRNYWLPNVTAGVIVGVVALPLAMAFAIASGVKPEQGLYTAIIAALFVSIFGGTNVQIAGPTGAFIVILANITAHYGIDGLQIATLLAGIILLLMGLAKLGNVIKFIPDPVIVGFTAGIGVIIFINEWKDFFGLSVELPINAHFYEKIMLLTKSLSTFNTPTTLLGIASLMIIRLSPKFFKKIPGPLVAMIIITLIQYLFHFNNVATLGSVFGKMPSHFPSMHIPSLGFNEIIDLLGPAFTIALLGAIESLLSACAADSMAGTKHDSNQELIGQGLANIFSPLFGGFAATGAIARTATSLRNGGNSPLAALIHSITLLCVLLFLAPLADSLPLCLLAAILFVVAYNMSDIPHFLHLIKIAPSYDVIVMFSTFFLTIFTNLVVAVNVGVILAMLFFIRRISQITGIEEQTQENFQEELIEYGLDCLPKNMVVYTIEGPLFFGIAEKVENTFANIHADPNIIIFRLKNVPFMDVTGMQTLKEIVTHYHQRNVQIYFCEAKPNVANKLNKMGMFSLIAKNKIFINFKDILDILKQENNL